MPEFFVWTTPGLIFMVEAESEELAADTFLGEPASRLPISGKQPACFVQATNGLEAPREDGSTLEFWRKSA